MAEKGDKRDFYEVLGAEEDATRDEIERRYKRLASQRHPDRGGSEEEMKDLNEAYRVLRDAGARDAYDSSRRERRQHQLTAQVAREDFVPASTPSAQADALGGRVAGALLSLFAGLVLVFLVRAHYVVFLWPLALLGAALVFFGIWMAHAAMVYAREGFAPTHVARRSAWAQEALFWSAVAGGGCAAYLLLTSV